jgi:hypothetical protein
MPTVPLSQETKQRMDFMFYNEDAIVAAHLLISECSNNLPFCENDGPLELERLRFAALKLSDGNVPPLLEAIELAQKDWRDLLMAAGFGEDAKAHEQWVPQKMG